MLRASTFLLARTSPLLLSTPALTSGSISPELLRARWAMSQELLAALQMNGMSLDDWLDMPIYTTDTLKFGEGK